MITQHNQSRPEEWRPVVGFPDYLVSDQGRVMSLVRAPRVLIGGTGGRGYRTVQLRTGGRPATRYVHQLTAEAFHGPRPEGMEVRHLDGNMLNNTATNLRWGTRRENNLDRIAHGTDRQASKTECDKGHPFDSANTLVNNRGARVCRVCSREAVARYRTRRALRAAGIEVSA